MRGFEVDLPDGRVLDALEAGAPDGTPLLFHNGTPASRLVAPWWDEACTAAGVRLLSYSRPGYGGSTPLPGRSVGDAAADAAAVLDACDVDRALVWGHSGGGPHALACAALLGDRVAACISSGGVAPYDAEGLDWLAGMGEANLEEFGMLAQGREHALAALEEEREALLGADPTEMAAAMATLMSPIDAAATTGEVSRFLSAAAAEGLRDSAEGWVDDDLAFVAPWGFDLGLIDVDVRIWHGEADLFVPPAHARWLAAALPYAQLHLRPDHGHLTLLAPAGFSEILRSLARPA